MDEHNNAKKTERKMTRREAGKQGGLAPHKCRGRQCNNRTKSSSNEVTGSTQASSHESMSAESPKKFSSDGFCS